MTGPTLLAFDFDGTLAPICNDPAVVTMSRGAEALLEHASRIPHLVVAIVSGRDVDDLSSRIDVPGAYVIGSHGLEIRGPGGVPVRDTAPLDVQLDESILSDIDRQGLRLERKKHALALHWRGIENAGDTIHRFTAWAEENLLDVIEGRCVVEARNRGEGKEEALRWLCQAIGARRVVYAGDDVTDFGPLQFAAERGRALFMASSERAAPPGTTAIFSFRQLFRAIREEVMI